MTERRTTKYQGYSVEHWQLSGVSLDGQAGIWPTFSSGVNGSGPKFILGPEKTGQVSDGHITWSWVSCVPVYDSMNMFAVFLKWWCANARFVWGRFDCLCFPSRMGATSHSWCWHYLRIDGNPWTFKHCDGNGASHGKSWGQSDAIWTVGNKEQCVPYPKNNQAVYIKGDSNHSKFQSPSTMGVYTVSISLYIIYIHNVYIYTFMIYSHQMISGNHVTFEHCSFKISWQQHLHMKQICLIVLT